jgi:putative intracellular protease/amidase
VFGAFRWLVGGWTRLASSFPLTGHARVDGTYITQHTKGTLEKYTQDSAVVVDGNAITSQGPGTSMAFALRLVDLLFGADKAKEVAGGLLVPYP